MSKGLTLACAGAVLLVCVAAEADVLKFTNGGELKGALEEVELLADGKTVKYGRGDVMAVWLSETGKDNVQMKDGTKQEGELASVKFKSIGGLLTFPRKELASIVLGEDTLEAARKEYQAKRAKVGVDDAKGLFELAQWCREKGLKAESVELARASLTADANSEVAAKAHELAGDVLYKDKWMTAAEAAKLREQEAGKVEPPKDPAPPVEQPKLTDDQIKALKESAAKNEELYKTYQGKAEDLRKDEFSKAKGKFESEWKALEKRVSDLNASIKADEDKIADLKKQYGTERYTTGYTWSTDLKTANDKLDKDKDDLKKAKVEAARMARQWETASSVVTSNAAKRRGRVTLAYQRHQRLLLTGRSVTADEMTNAFEAALKTD